MTEDIELSKRVREETLTKREREYIIKILKLRRYLIEDLSVTLTERQRAEMAYSYNLISKLEGIDK